MNKNEFAQQLQHSQTQSLKQRWQILNALEQQGHSLLLLAAHKHYNSIQPDDVAYIMNYVQWLSRDMQKKRGCCRASAASKLGNSYGLIFKLEQAEVHFARRIRSLLHKKIKNYINQLYSVFQFSISIF